MLIGLSSCLESFLCNYNKEKRGFSGKNTTLLSLQTGRKHSWPLHAVQQAQYEGGVVLFVSALLNKKGHT